ncbi:MAG: RNA polymerase sigma factor [Hungatella sp.]
MEHAISYDTFAARPQPRLLHSVYSLIASILCLTSHKTQTSSKALDREIINQQAEQFFHHYGNHILRLAYSYLHNLSDAEEILQETLIRYLDKAPVFEHAEHEKAWLCHVASNLSKNRLKYNSIRSTDELQEELVAEEREDLSFVWEAVKNLPDKYREVIHLYYYEGYPTAEIARILKRNESTVRSDLRRGREQLKEQLKEAYDFE